MDIIRKDKNQIFFNEDNEHIPGNILDSEDEDQSSQQTVVTQEYIVCIISIIIFHCVLFRMN